MPSRPSALPDAVVGPAPDRRDMIDGRSPARPKVLLDLAAGRRAEKGHADDLAVDVELELLRCGIPDANRLGLLVPR